LKKGSGLNHEKNLRVSLDTRDKKTIAEDASFSSILNGCVVILTDSGRYVLDQDGTRVPLGSEGFTYKLYFYGFS